jgi:hypothetical protein
MAWPAPLRNRAGEHLLLITADYEQLHFVLIEREAERLV